MNQVNLVSLSFIVGGLVVIVIIASLNHLLRKRYYLTPQNSLTAKKLVAMGFKQEYLNDTDGCEHEVYEVNHKLTRRFKKRPGDLSLLFWRREKMGVLKHYEEE